MYKDAQRVTAAFALGFVGFWVGTLTAYSFAVGCNCGGNQTLYIGGFTGAALGATAGYMLVR
jgi:hypothetical protein